MERETNYLVIARKFAYCYLFLLCTFFLFVITNYYFNITYTKSVIFTFLTLLFMIITSFLYICHKITLKKEVPDLKWKDIIHISKTDILLLLLFISCFITTLLSDYKGISCFGYARYTGLLFLICSLSAYFMISRLYLQQQSIILMFLCSVSIIVIIGVFQFFYIDPMNLFKYTSDYRANFFISTIGNINFFSSLICLSLPLSIILFIHCKNQTSKIIYSITTIIGFIGLLISNSDSGYLGMFFILLVILMFCFKNIAYLKRYLLVLIYFIGSFKIMGLIIYLFNDHCRGIHTFSYFIANRTFSLIALIVLILLLFAINIYEDKVEIHLQTIKKIVCGIIIVGILVIISSVVYFSFINKTVSLGTFENYFRYNDLWGTGRGKIWNKTLYSYSQLPLIQRLFGYGLDTTNQLLVNECGKSMLRYDNAHNEFIQYLVTTGIVGLGLYLSVFICSVKKAIKYMEDEPIVFAYIAVIICYLVQSIVNINQPITTPFLFVFLGMLENHIRLEKHK